MWTNRSGKEAFREKLLECLPRHKPIFYRGLPGIDLVFERRLLEEKFKIGHLELFETDVGNFYFIKEKLKNHLEKDAYSFTCKDIDKATIGGNANIDLFWYDYCGPVTQQRLETMDALCFNLEEGQTYAVTFMVGRERDLQGLLEFWLAKDDVKEVLAIEDPLLRRIQFLYLVLKRANSSTSPLRVEAYTYQDTVPMISLVIKRSTKMSLTIKALDKELAFEDEGKTSLENLSADRDADLMQRIEKALEKGSFKRVDVWTPGLMHETTFTKKIRDLIQNGLLVSHGEKRGRFYTKGAAWKTL